MNTCMDMFRKILSELIKAKLGQNKDVHFFLNCILHTTSPLIIKNDSHHGGVYWNEYFYYTIKVTFYYKKSEYWFNKNRKWRTDVPTCASKNRGHLMTAIIIKLPAIHLTCCESTGNRGGSAVTWPAAILANYAFPAAARQCSSRKLFHPKSGKF